MFMRILPTHHHAIVAAKLLNITCSFVAAGHDVYEFAYDIEYKISSGSDFVVAVLKTCSPISTTWQKNIKLLL
ncbi:hypothetical protein O9993_19315 [Vibrio lentus]|nr:hypothetical protein [Vibrio lentus]